MGLIHEKTLQIYSLITRCHSIKNTFLAIWPTEHPRRTLPEWSFSPWAAENLLTSAFGFSKAAQLFLSAAPLLNLSCWSKPVKDSVFFVIKPHDRKFLSVSIHPCLSLKLEPLPGHMGTSGLWVLGCRAGSEFYTKVTFRSSLLVTLWPNGHTTVGGSFCLRSNRFKQSADSPSMWSELAVVDKLARLTDDYLIITNPNPNAWMRIFIRREVDQWPYRLTVALLQAIVYFWHFLVGPEVFSEDGNHLLNLIAPEEATSWA